MKKVTGIIALLFFFAGLFSSCFKPDTQVTYYVYITKKVDSLPCEVEVNYPDLGKYKTVSADADWSFSQKVHYDQNVNLKATVLSNVKSLKVEIYAKESPVTESCENTCTTIQVTKALYE